MNTEQFIKERLYLVGVSPKTVAWYEDSLKTFNGALDSQHALNGRVIELHQRGVKPVSINT